VSTEVAPADVIDVYADTVPGPRQRLRGQRPASHPTPASSSHDFRTPNLETPTIERPATWPETEVDRGEILRRLAKLEAAATSNELRRRTVAVGLMLDWLETFPGATWQHRWLASGVDGLGPEWADDIRIPGLLPGLDGRAQLTGAIGRLILLGALRPSYLIIYRLRSATVLRRFRALRDPDGFATLDALCDATARFTALDRNFAFHQLSRILMHNGGRLADITVDDCIEAYRAQVGYAARQHGHWYPPTIWAASRRGQLRVEELIDGYDLVCTPVRDLLVEYLRERQASMDYTSLRQLASKLALLFWRDLELHEPGINSLHLGDDVIRRWKERLRVVRYGTHGLGRLREDPNTVLIAVRAFYADLAAWALEDPGRWAVWAAPNPINGRDLLGQNKLRKRATARMHQRIRELAPLLPALVSAADERRRRASDLLAAARATAPGDEFEAAGERLVRVSIVTDPTRGGTGRPGLVYAAAPPAGGRRNLTLEEECAFWAWAIVEVLRHTGVRIEEMLELTHRSFVAEVLTLIISRVRNGAGSLPLVTRYDGAERLHSPPLPFLFQRPWGLANHIVTPHRVKVLLDSTAAAAGLTDAGGAARRFTPHDFRRIFATEAVATGLPVHIAAKLLGHQSLATTQAYVAVYDQDVIDHHRAFIARRRGLRPSEEYREPTEAEWEEFLGHFERRKVELGICGRAYGTPCQHEHACVRCPMLRPDPKQLGRLVEIIDNLNARVAEANDRGWLGEVEGLVASLAGAEQKLATMRRASVSAETSMRLGPTRKGLPGRISPDMGRRSPS